MASYDTRNIQDVIRQIAFGREELAIVDSLNLDLSILPLLAEHLSKDLPIETLERFEAILKSVLHKNLPGSVSGEVARNVAEFQKDIGLLCKYKSYAIKCASPLGYSIFLQNESEGFSFQRHITHKTEVFHILDVKPGGFVFICNFKDWKECYEQDSFSSWLAGAADDRYERFRYRPKSGDVFTISELGVVHTVVGCVLEEFATISTDMVDRLHDQNASRAIPTHFDRKFVQDQLAGLSFPDTSRHVNNSASGVHHAEILPQKIKGGWMTPLARTAIIASRYAIEPGQESALLTDEQNATSLYVAGGVGRVIIADRDEAVRMTPPSVPVTAGNVLMIPAGAHYGFVNEGSGLLTLSEQRIPFDIAFGAH